MIEKSKVPGGYIPEPPSVCVVKCGLVCCFEPVILNGDRTGKLGSLIFSDISLQHFLLFNFGGIKVNISL